MFAFGKNVFEDDKILYHETYSVFSKYTERNGWSVTNQSYTLNDVLDIGQMVGISKNKFGGT